MGEPMLKICRLIVQGYRQFEDTDLDFTDPATGEPANRVCLIGRNGTGKSTVLVLLDLIIGQGLSRKGSGSAVMKVKTDTRSVYVLPSSGSQPPTLLDEAIEGVDGWKSSLRNASRLPRELAPYKLPLTETKRLLGEVTLHANGSDLFVFSPPEATDNCGPTISDVPETTVAKALSLRDKIPFRHVVSNANIVQMWTHLVFLMKQRDEEREAFERLEENLDKSKRELIAAFDGAHPNPLHGLARLWDRILEPAGLEFDVEGANNPIQLTDNLKAYIRLKSTKERVSYGQLSTGIRNYLFRIGHIYLLYFNRRITRGFVLIDEPENSLFPDFLFDLVKTYDEIVQLSEGGTGTQLFFATHSPIVAAQFAPHERLILEWDDDGRVRAKKGVAPKGDDPNDVLQKDFELRHLMGEEGRRMWDEYLDLRKQIRRTTDPRKKDDLVKRAADLGRRYSFPEP